MPLLRAERNIDLLTDGWPGEPEDFELAAFAARFRADRPELSAPALDRIGRQIESELVRVDRSTARKLGIRATVLRFRRFAPLAAALSALAVGGWLYFRPDSPAGSARPPAHGVPVIHSQPPPSPDGAPVPAPSKLVVN